MPSTCLACPRQGYADLNFLIPEVVGDLHYKKGPYYADEATSRPRAPPESDWSMKSTRARAGIWSGWISASLVDGSSSLAGGVLLGAGESITMMSVRCPR